MKRSRRTARSESLRPGRTSRELASDPSVLRVAKAALAEAHRARALLRAVGHQRPYLVSHLLKDEEGFRTEARYGTLFAEERRRERHCFTDVRVGSYRYDHLQDGGLLDNSREAEHYELSRLPVGVHVDGVLHGLWKLTECRYREAVESLLRKRADELHYRNEHRELGAFQRVDPIVSTRVGPAPEIDVEHWTRFAERASAIGRRHPELTTCTVEVEARHITRTFVSSEGALVIDRTPIWSLFCHLTYMVHETGEYLPWTITRHVTSPDELPTLDAFKREIRKTLRVLAKIARAPSLRAYSGPVWLDPQPAGLLVHEALGHRLEGNRLLSKGEGQTFRDALETGLLPPTLRVYDDPRLTTFEGQSVIGHYRFDDEGMPATHAELLADGGVRGFLTTRAPVAPRHKSNGHARAETFERPVSRMAVTVVEGTEPVSARDMRRMLLEEVRRRNLPFGVRVLDAEGGETATKAYDFQAFLGEVKLATRIFPDGSEELIRGVNFVGTPLNAVGGIVAVGNDRRVDNSYCGAESGYVPVTTISPSVLVEDLELQSDARRALGAYTYPLPW